MSIRPIQSDNDITVFAETDFRDRHQRFGIKRKDRRSHMYLIGRTGVGKSTMLETLMRSDLRTGEGLILLDPHGDLAERVVGSVPESRQADLLYFNPADDAGCLALNVLE